MRQPQAFEEERQHRTRTPSPPGNQSLPSLQESLMQHRHDDVSRLARPSVITTRLFQEPWFTGSVTASNSVPPSSNAIPIVDDSLSPSLASLDDEPAPPEPSSSPWSESSSMVSDPSPRESSDPQQGKRKRPRFLGDIDRRVIIQRLENGEKQSDLAREFGVTRAAICHINKNRDEILTRFDILAKSPQGRQMIENYVRSPHFSTLVRELRTPSVAVLVTRLRDTLTPPTSYKSTADRLMGILLEDALVGFGIKPVKVDRSGPCGSNGYDGKEYTRGTFALAMGDDARPLVDTFASMEPSSFQGVVHGQAACAEQEDSENLSLELPENPADTNVLVLQASLLDAEKTHRVLQALQRHGVAASAVCVVCLHAATSAVTTLASRYRDLKLVTAAIHGETDEPLFVRFAERYAEAHSS